MTLVKPLLLSVAVALTVTAPAAAAPALSPLRPCYVSIGEQQREPVTVSGTGFTPNAALQVLVDGVIAAEPVAASDGSLRVAVPAPFQASGEREFSITVIERDNSASAATVAARVTDFTVGIRPRRATPRSRVRFSGRGFTDRSRPVYAHYLRGGKVRRTVRLARPRGACGTFSVKRPQFPIRRPRTGTWVLLLDQSKRYRRTTARPRWRVDIRVTSRPRLAPRTG